MWFKAKKSGFGMQPCSKEGYLLSFGLYAVLILVAWLTGVLSPLVKWSNGVVFLVLWAIIGIAFHKTFSKKCSGNLKW